MLITSLLIPLDILIWAIVWAGDKCRVEETVWSGLVEELGNSAI
jgi:hypothetical protein